MSQPTSMEEYVARFGRNQATTGYGIEGVTQHCPCPFCAAADWLVFRVLDTKEALRKGATCRECGRSARAHYRVDLPGHVEFEMVQTGGPDQPEWLQPKMRRVE